MNIRMLCLAILHRGDATGYEIRKLSTEGQFGHFVDASYGSIYPALAKLESDGLVTVREESHPGKPARKIYSLAAAGRETFAGALIEPPAHDTYRSEFLLIAMFAELVDPQHMKQVIDARVEHVKAELTHMREMQSCCDHPGTSWTINYGMAVFKASLDHLEKHRKELENVAGSAAIAPPIAAE